MKVMPGKLEVSKKTSDIFEVIGIGAGVVVVMYDKANKAGGIVHLLLASTRAQAGGGRSSMSAANTAIPFMLEEMKKLGADPSSIEVKALGGASLQGALPGFSMGDRIHKAIISALEEIGLSLSKKDIGGNYKRNVKFHIADGSLEIKSFKGKG